jgi:hypothetical protein
MELIHVPEAPKYVTTPFPQMSLVNLPPKFIAFKFSLHKPNHHALQQLSPLHSLLTPCYRLGVIFSLACFCVKSSRQLLLAANQLKLFLDGKLKRFWRWRG